MTFASKNMKVFSCFYRYNDNDIKNNLKLHLAAKMKFIDEDTDFRLWSCNSFKRQQYLFEILSEEKNGMQITETLTYRTETNEEVSKIKEPGLYGDGTSVTSDCSKHSMQVSNQSAYSTPDSQTSEGFTIRFKECPSFPKLPSDEKYTIIEVEPSNHSLHTLFVGNNYCPICKKIIKDDF